MIVYIPYDNVEWFESLIISDYIIRKYLLVDWQLNVMIIFLMAILYGFRIILPVSVIVSDCII
jgi:hypothetical protein